MSHKSIRIIDLIYKIENFQLDFDEKIISFFKNYLYDEYSLDNFFIIIIFVSKQEILSLNNNYLNHDYLTDIITFDYSEDYGYLVGDLYICGDVVSQNSINFKTNIEEEFMRVISHGFLHLLGYNDKTTEQRNEMTKMENIMIAKILNYLCNF